MTLPNAQALRHSAAAFDELAHQYQQRGRDIERLAAPPGWAGAPADAFGRAARRLAEGVRVGEEAHLEVASSLRNLAGVVEHVAPEHAVLTSKRLDLDLSATPTDVIEQLIQRQQLDAQLHGLEVRITAAASAAAATVDAMTSKASVASAGDADGLLGDLQRRVADGVGSALRFGGHVAQGFGSGTVAMARGLFDLGRKFNSVRLLTDPYGYGRDLAALGSGYAQFAKDLKRDPGGTLYKAFDISGLKNDPGRWIGEQIPGLLVGAATGGAGAAAAKAVLRRPGSPEAPEGASTQAPVGPTTKSPFVQRVEGGDRTEKVLDDARANGASAAEQSEILRAAGAPQGISEVAHPKVRTVVSQLYTSVGGHGDGSTMAAVRLEIETQQPINNKWHFIKLDDAYRSLNNAKSGLSDSDTTTVSEFQAAHLEPILQDRAGLERLRQAPGLPPEQAEAVDKLLANLR